MWGFTIAAAAFMAAFFVIALAWGGAGIVIALPLALVALGAGFLLDLRRRSRVARSAHNIQDRARNNKVEFTERDKQTLTRK